MDALKSGWFSEIGELWPGQCLSLEIEKVLYEGKSKYQDILVFQSKNHGNVLVLDGVIQLTDWDECSYQEMITHLPMFAHKSPKKVLVIGGGDGGVLRELGKHDCVERIDFVEIDEMVVEISKKYMRKTAIGFDNPKVHPHFMDGFEFLRQHAGEYDVIISDSSDPIGPAECLFRAEFYELASRALSAGGVICTQCESIWLHMNIIRSTITKMKPYFSLIQYASVSVPTYPSGCIGFALGRKEVIESLSCPIRPVVGDEFKFYTEGVHKAAFVLPKFAEKEIVECLSA